MVEDSLDVLLREFEVKNVSVLNNVAVALRPRNHGHVSLLEEPPQGNLCRRLSVPVVNVMEELALDDSPSRQWAVRSQQYFVVDAVFENVGLVGEG